MFRLLRTSSVLTSVHRYTVTLKRKFPLEVPSILWGEGIIPNLSVKQQIYEEVKTDSSDTALIDVLLTTDVPGLGTMGTVTSVHRNRFWRYLYPLKMAELPTTERVNYFLSQSTGRPRVLCSEGYESEQRLLNMTLFIPMNPTWDWVLNPTHVKVAFRKYGIVVDEDAIVMPNEAITRNNANASFTVGVKIENIVTVPVLSRIFLYQKLDKLTCTQPPANVFKPLHLDDWKADFPDEELCLTSTPT